MLTHKHLATGNCKEKDTVKSKTETKNEGIGTGLNQWEVFRAYRLEQFHPHLHIIALPFGKVVEVLLRHTEKSLKVLFR